MINAKNWIKFHLVLLFLLGSNLLFAGPGDAGGGGSVIQCRNWDRPQLLDVLTSLPNLVDQALPARQQNKILSIDEIREIALHRVSNWRMQFDSSPDVSWALLSLLEEVIRSMSFTKVDLRFKVLPRHYLPSQIREECPNVQTAILFLQSRGAIVSSPVWDPLDINVQVGLVIHEALRQIQVIYLNGFSEPGLTDTQIQGITGQIMVLEPCPLAFNSWMDGKFQIAMLSRLKTLKPEAFQRANINSQVKELGYSKSALSDFIDEMAQFSILLLNEFQSENARASLSSPIEQKRFELELRNEGILE